MSQESKVSVVTGGAQGIGYQIVKRLFDDGFKVAIVDFNGEGAIQAAQSLTQDDSKVLAIKADVANRDDIFSAINQTVEHFGDFHVLVSNAGLGPMTPIDSITPEDFDKVYGSSKFAVRGLTQVAARDLAHESITVNAFAPGIVQTPMMEGIAKKTAEEAGKPESWGWKQFTDQIALGKLSQPEDVSNVVSFLAGKDSDYITGQTIIVDGGMRFH